MADLQAQKRALLAKRAQIDAQLAEVDKQIQAACTHVWRWHQIAGEGRYCTICGAVDHECDD